MYTVCSSSPFSHRPFKGTVSRDFSSLVFFMKLCLLGPWLQPYLVFDFFFIRRDIRILRLRNLTFRSLCRGKSYFSAAYATESHIVPQHMPRKIIFFHSICHGKSYFLCNLSETYAAESHIFPQPMPRKVIFFRSICRGKSKLSSAYAAESNDAAESQILKL